MGALTADFELETPLRLDLARAGRVASFFVLHCGADILLETALLDLDSALDPCVGLEDLPASLYRPEIEKRSPILYEELCAAVLGRFFVVEWLEFLKVHGRELEGLLFEDWLCKMRGLSAKFHPE